MKPRILFCILLVLMCMGLSPWGPEGMGRVASCQAMTTLTKLVALSQVRADGSRVTLLHLFDPSTIPEDWKAVLGQADIGEAPAIGSEKVINPGQLKAYVENFLSSKNYDFKQLQFVLPDSISVRRQSNQLSKEQIEDIFKDFVLSKAPWNPQDITIRSIYYSGSVDLPAGEMNYEVTANPRERFLGNVALTIQFLVNGTKERSLKVTGKVEVMQNVVHALRPMKRNDIVSSGDVEVQRINISDTPDRYVTSPDQIVGKRLVREVGLRQPIPLADFDSPNALKRGLGVTIIYEQGGLRLTAKGQTREEGSVGSTIRVVNVMTNKTIFCRVLDSTTVQAMP